MPTEASYVPGLAGVPAARSAICSIDGEKGILEYRGIRIEELADRSTFEETAYLLLFGKLPNRKELEGFERDLKRHRRLKYKIVDLLKCLPEGGSPMEALQAATAGLGMYYPAMEVMNPEVRRISAIRLIAKFPTIVATYARLKKGDEPVRPSDDLGLAANFLYMLTEQQPDPTVARVMDVALILHAEHSMNASTFAARVIGSTLADPFTTVSGAVGALRGPLHGGANEEVIQMLRAIGSADKARAYVEGKVARKEIIMGMGHRVYKTKDPRAHILQRLAQEIFKVRGASPLYPIAQEVEKTAVELLGAKGVYPNVDFYSGIVYDLMGLASELFTPIFAIARVAGWLAHWFEQLTDNRIYRPDQIYVGPTDVPYTPLGKRT